MLRLQRNIILRRPGLGDACTPDKKRFGLVGDINTRTATPTNQHFIKRHMNGSFNFHLQSSSNHTTRKEGK
jgi:hypothetical protein